ncbi:unnamed protein product, partial [Cuscuta campestris]
MVITKWTPDHSEEEDCPTVPVWVACPKLPIYLHDQRALALIASSLGRPLKVDENTLNFSRPDLALFCVEVDVSKPLPAKVHLKLGDKDSFFPLIFENVPHYCSTCMKLGHLKGFCRRSLQGEKKLQPPHPVQIVGEEPVQRKGKEQLQEQWTMVTSKKSGSGKEWRRKLVTFKSGPGECSSQVYSKQLQDNSPPDIITDVPVASPSVFTELAANDSNPVYPPAPANKKEVKNLALVLWKPLPIIEESTFTSLLSDQGDSDSDESDCEDLGVVDDQFLEKPLAALPVLPTQNLDAQMFNLNTTIKSRLSSVYGKHTRNDRLPLWESITNHNPVDQPWIVGGDFNTVTTLTEHQGNVPPCLRSMEDFTDCILTCSLLDPCLKGNTFTWMGNRTKGRVLRRLDRVLINQATIDQHSEIFLYHLGKTSSNHKPLLLDCINYQYNGPKPFRFLNAWTLDKSFIGLVKESWNSTTNGRGMRGLASKLKSLKKCIKEWNNTHFGNIFSQVKEAELEDLQAQEKYELDDSANNREACNLAHAKLLKACNKEENYWAQKANIKWLSSGDASTKFFHSFVKGKRRKASIRLLKNQDGKEMVDQNEISSYIVSHFEATFSLTHMGNQSLKTILPYIPNLITETDNINLVQLPLEEEIKEAVWQLNPNSSAGPDGYNGEFFRHCWDIIKADIVSATQEFFLGIPIPMAFGSTYVTLIPKVEGAKVIGDYRPIALSTFFSKLTSRIMANRLSPLLIKLISPEQAGFQKGKGIEEHILLTNELMHKLESKIRGGNIMIKLDMAKAFDKMSWSYLRAVLTAFGFKEKCISLLLQSLESTHMSILINGKPSGFFKIKRGVKQGDPLSPLLFILGSEGFSRSLKQAINSGFISPFKAGRSPVVSHLAFADDLIVFLRGDFRNLLRFKYILSNYLRASGQEVNNSKSKIFCKKTCHVTYRKKVEEALGFKVGNPPFKYLGSTITTGKLKRIDCDQILHHFDAYLNSWYNKELNPMSRLILIKHVLSAIPLHTLAVQDNPKSIINQIHSKLANFFWGSKARKNKHHWSKWVTLCRPSGEGGLCIRSLDDIQKASALKLWWKSIT